MDPRSQVLLRQASLFTGPLLLAGLPADELLGALPDAVGWSWLADDQQTLNRRFPERCHFGIQPQTKACGPSVLFLPKSREHTEYLLHTLAANSTGHYLYLVGEKRAGIEGAAKQLKAFGTPRKLDSARHCQLWQVKVEQTVTAPTPQAGGFEILDPLGNPLPILSLPGVFSHGRLDQGTALLLKHLADLPQGPLLDFGCGAGVIGASLKRLYPTQEVLMLDVDAFALESARQTLSANQLEAQLIAGDGIDAAPLNLAAIVSNPPFHQGVHTSYAATEALLCRAAQHLKTGGVLRLVANSFLQYPPLIEKHLGPCQTLAEANGFKIYQATKR